MQNGGNPHNLINRMKTPAPEFGPRRGRLSTLVAVLLLLSLSSAAWGQTKDKIIVGELKAKLATLSGDAQLPTLLELAELTSESGKEQENLLFRKDNALQEQTIRNTRNLRNALVAIIALVLLLVGLVYSRYRLKSRANRELEAANIEIRSKQDQLSEAFLKMEELARTDALTGLPNRRAMIEKLAEEEVRFKRGLKPFCLVMIDLDRFKSINDQYGHDSGDFLLKSCASSLRSSVRGQDQVGRWGGDEFLVLLPETDLVGGRTVMETIGDLVAGASFTHNGRDLRTDISWGISEFREGLTLDDCLREADAALYQNKKREPRPNP